MILSQNFMMNRSKIYVNWLWCAKLQVWKMKKGYEMGGEGAHIYNFVMSNCRHPSKKEMCDTTLILLTRSFIRIITCMIWFLLDDDIVNSICEYALHVSIFGIRFYLLLPITVA